MLFRSHSILFSFVVGILITVLGQPSLGLGTFVGCISHIMHPITSAFHNTTYSCLILAFDEALNLMDNEALHPDVLRFLSVSLGRRFASFALTLFLGFTFLEPALRGRKLKQASFETCEATASFRASANATSLDN